MERESFENPAIAAFMNKNFISIKVDREERPEVDSLYMSAVQAMTGQGGWPLSVFLTPDQKPFYGGTYFPAEPRYGMPSFKQVIEYVAKLWKDKRDELTGNADQILAAVSQRYQNKPGAMLTTAALDDGYAALISSFDREWGGFGGAPKFPLPSYLSFLLRYHYRTGKEMALSSVLKTLDGIAAGGIHDHIGGGFHRYSTDRVWLVPHFEKMLYDNALLARVYIEASLVTGEARYASTARDALDWVLAEMRSPEGGFYSAQDADTSEGEGVYYTLTPDEVSKAVGEADAPAFCGIFGVTNRGNFEGGRSILTRSHPLSETAEKLGVTTDALESSVTRWRSEVYRARRSRPRPATDTKILTSWNGLAISAFAHAGQAFGQEKYTEAAEGATEFVIERLTKDGGLLRRFAGGEAALDGTLEDYAFFTLGLLDLFGASSKPRWLEQAIALGKRMVESFWDGSGGGFLLSSGATLVKVKEAYDGPTPSGNSAAAVALLRLAELTGDAGFREKADGVLKAFGEEVEAQPTGHTNMLVALDLASKGMKEVVITARTAKDAAPFRREFDSRFMPDEELVVATESNQASLGRLSPLLEDRPATGSPTVYICQNFACRRPITDLQELKEELTRGS